MGKHEQGYLRIERDYYPTPRWPIEALLEHIDIGGLHILEPACGDGRMVEVLQEAGADVIACDVEDRGYNKLHKLVDFTQSTQLDMFEASSIGKLDGIITNPPLGKRGELGVAFIQVGLVRIGDDGFLALLLTADFDSAKTRRFLFGKCPRFAGKIILTKRIKWFENPDCPHSPKENNAWFLWGRIPFRSFDLPCRPVLRYAPSFQ
jgi:hypothetical protein